MGWGGVGWGGVWCGVVRVCLGWFPLSMRMTNMNMNVNIPTAYLYVELEVDVDMCVYVYVYMCLLACVYVCVCLRGHACLCIYNCNCKYICMCICMSMYVYMCMSMCVYVHMFVCIYMIQHSSFTGVSFIYVFMHLCHTHTCEYTDVSLISPFGCMQNKFCRAFSIVTLTETLGGLLQRAGRFAITRPQKPLRPRRLQASQIPTLHIYRICNT